MPTVHLPTKIVEIVFELAFIAIVQEPSAKDSKSNDFVESHLPPLCIVPLCQPLARGHKRGTRVFPVLPRSASWETASSENSRSHRKIILHS